MQTDDGVLTILAEDIDGRRLVRLSGEVDLAARGVIIAACVICDGCDVVIDLSGATFMDCAGYASLLLARANVVGRGTVTFCNATGQPARLLELIARLESHCPTPGAARIERLHLG